MDKDKDDAERLLDEILKKAKKDREEYDRTIEEIKKFERDRFYVSYNKNKKTGKCYYTYSITHKNNESAHSFGGCDLKGIKDIIKAEMDDDEMYSDFLLWLNNGLRVVK